MLKKILKKLIPGPISASLHNFRILSFEYGQYKTMCQKESVDKDNNPIPWYTYPAIEYIKQLNISDKTIFEYGSGNSTRFWAARCKKLVSVEDNEKWYSKVKPCLPSNVEYLFFNDKVEYSNAVNSFSEKFDIIIIDGNYRYSCAVNALANLKDDGFIILDNSDWRGKTSELLRKADLIEVDMSGFGPLTNYTSTTSFYFSRSVKLRPAFNIQPVHGIGSVHNFEIEKDEC